MTARARIRWHGRIYLRIYLSVLAIVAMLAMMLSLAWYVHSDPREFGTTLRALATVVAEVLPPASAPDAAQQAVLARWHPRMNMDLALYGADGRVIAVAGAPNWPSQIPPLATIRLGANPPDYPLPLHDGRWLLIHGAGRTNPQPHRLLVAFALIALAVGFGCYPIVRRLTRRLEQLQRGVDAWGAGTLSERVEVTGNDEVAVLAASFNSSADRIEALVRSQKTLLSNASHELRSPLARIRLAVELLPGQTPESLRAEFRQNITELDQLVGEILLASRLDAQGSAAIVRHQLDFTALAKEECAAVDASLRADASSLHGDPILLRRLLRNLLENAGRHGGRHDVDVSITTSADGIELQVSDRGPGVPEGDRERVFEPFYRLPGTNEASGGVGLGLSLVRQIAEAHGGHARCIAPRVPGACFQVRLPSL